MQGVTGLKGERKLITEAVPLSLDTWIYVPWQVWFQKNAACDFDGMSTVPTLAGFSEIPSTVIQQPQCLTFVSCFWLQ